VSALGRARSDECALKQGRFGYGLGRGASAGLWDGDGRITCFRNRSENVRDDVDISFPVLIVILLVAIGDLIKSRSPLPKTASF